MLSDVFFSAPNIPAPDFHLGVGSGSHGVQTSAILTALDPILKETQPDWVVAYSEIDLILAAAVCAVNLRFPIAHLEAGLCSFNRRIPEEINRISFTGHAADLLLAPTEVVMGHTVQEGLRARSVLVGDVMTDVLWGARDQVAGCRPTLGTKLCLKADGFTDATHYGDGHAAERVINELVGRVAG